MALHGDIKVNGTIIGVWAAVRKDTIAQSEESLRHNGPKYRYACEMSLNGNKVTTEVSHYYNDGAAALLQKICKLY